MNAWSFAGLAGPWPRDAEQAAATRARRLRRLARHAAAHSPYWRELFRSLSLSPDELCSAEALARLPVLKRETLHARIEAIRIESADADRFKTEKSNGTTGTPLAIHTTAAELRFKHALWFSGYMHLGLRPWHSQGKLMMSGAIPATRRAFQRLGVFRRAYYSVTLPVDKKIEALRALKPDAVFAWGSVFNEIAARLKTRGESLSIPLIFSSSAAVQRELVASTLNGRVFDIYGAMEHGPLAWPCAAGKGFHIDPRWTILEILDDRDRPARRGRLVCTSLWRRTTPLLRYDLEDEGEWGDGPCGCADPHPRLAVLHGRQSEFVVLPNGERLTSGLFASLLQGRRGIRQYRIVQRSAREFTLLIVPGEGFGAETLDGIRADTGRQFGDGAVIETRLTQELFYPVGHKLPPLMTLERMERLRRQGVEIMG